MSTARDLADRLLDAQVAYLLDDLSAARLPDILAVGVDDLLELAGHMVLQDVVDADRVKLIVRRVADRSVSSPLVADLAIQITDALDGLDAADDHRLGAVVARERVDALVAKLVGMRTLQNRALDRLADSPAVADIASAFVGKLLADVIAQNRAMAQKVPGMSSLLSLGTSAAGMVRNPLDQLFGDAAGRSAQFALRRSNGARRELIDEATLHRAALEVWDLHADEPVAALREYLEDGELRQLVELGLALVTDVAGTPFAAAALDACVDVLFARYGEWDLASLLTEVGVERDDLVADLAALAPPIVAAAKADGRLAALLRTRLEPFFHSDAVLAMLPGAEQAEAGTDAAPKPKPKPRPS
jgi:hypothetical protein